MTSTAHLVARMALALLVGWPPATPGVDLVADLTAHPNPAVVGSPVEVDLTIHNAGTAQAHLVQARIELSGDRVVDAIAGTDCVAVGSVRLERGTAMEMEPWTITCEEGSLGRGETRTVTVTSHRDGVGSSSAGGEVVSRETDVRPQDNIAEVLLVTRSGNPALG